MKWSESRSVVSDSLRPHGLYGIFQARILEWVDFPFSRESSQPRDRTQVSCIAGRFFTSWATRKGLLANTGDIRDVGSILGLGRSPGGGHGDPFQYSCLENPLDRGAWWVTVHRITECWMQLKWPHAHVCISWYVLWTMREVMRFIHET